MSWLSRLFRWGTSVGEELGQEMINMEPQKRALLVGIDKYSSPGINFLSGCVNDVKDMRQLLIEKGFEPDKIRILTDYRATYGAILKRLNWLVQNTRPGDESVFYFSGHGTQIRDRNHDELDDFLDECLVCTDHDWDRPLTDDIIADELSKVSEDAHMAVIFDSCHSGTATRFFGAADHSNYRAARYLPVPFDIEARSVGRNLELRTVKANAQEMNYVFLGGCRDDQTSEETIMETDSGKLVRGALTFFFTMVMRQNPTLGWKDIYESMLSLMRGRFEQIPQIGGKSDLLALKPFDGKLK